MVISRLTSVLGNIYIFPVILRETFSISSFALFLYVTGNQGEITKLKLENYGDAHLIDSGWREIDPEEWFKDSQFFL